MTKEPKSAAVASTDPRGKIVDALMALASERRFEEISLRDICAAAKVSLADFRDAFPSKGAVLAGFTRRIDRAVLSKPEEEISQEAPRERLFDVLMRRLDAMAPYREALQRDRAGQPLAVDARRLQHEAHRVDHRRIERQRRQRIAPQPGGDFA